MRRFDMFQYSCLLWLVNAVLVILSYFVAGLINTALILFPAAFVSFGMMIFLRGKEQVDFLQTWKNSATWSKVITIISVIYTFVNFIICIFLLRDGGPHIDNGMYCLWNHGFVREITEEEYNALLIVEGRLFIGHILFLSAIPVMFFSGRKNAKHLDL